MYIYVCKRTKGYTNVQVCTRAPECQLASGKNETQIQVRMGQKACAGTLIQKAQEVLMSFNSNVYLARKIWNGDLDMSSQIMQLLGSPFGYTQMRNTQDSVKTQIAYNDYIRKGNERALQDWNRNVGSQYRIIQYPELSYAGAMYRADTGSARAMYDYSNAGANFVGNLAYRGAGLYGIGSRISRWL